MHTQLRPVAAGLFLALAGGPLSSAVAAEPAPGPGTSGWIDLITIEPVVVTATRTYNPVIAVGTAVDRVSAADVAGRQQSGLAAALGTTPGAPLFASGAKGTATSLFLRGSNSNQTLFLVDGIRFSDANADYNFFLGGASLGKGDTVEIARGPQSTLYGSDAIGGVVAIGTDRGGDPSAGPLEPAGTDRHRASFTVESGSFGTLGGAVATEGADGPWAYRLNLDAFVTNNERTNNDFTSTGGNARIDRTLSPAFDVGATARWHIGKLGDPSDRFIDDPDDSLREENVLVTVFANGRPTTNWSVRTILGGQNRRLVSDASYGAAFPNVASITTNRRSVLDAQGTWSGWPRHRVTVGTTGEIAHTRNTGFGDINQRQNAVAFFAQDEFSPAGGWDFSAGVRQDRFDTFGQATTGRFTGAWQVVPQRAKLRASYGTGFRAPSFLDLYGRSAFYVGNPNVKPEHARGWDVGFDLLDRSRTNRVSVSWFENRYSDLIAGDFTVFPTTVANVAEARTRGAEVAGELQLTDRIGIQASYTYLEADNLTTGSRLLRRPRQTALFDVRHRFGNIVTGFGGMAVIDREDIHAATFATVDGENYFVARAYAAWRVRPSLSLRLRLENLLDEDYEPVHGYPANSFGAFVSLELTR